MECLWSILQGDSGSCFPQLTLTPWGRLWAAVFLPLPKIYSSVGGQLAHIGYLCIPSKACPETRIWVQVTHVEGNPSQRKGVGRRQTGKEGKPMKSVIELVATLGIAAQFHWEC